MSKTTNHTHRKRDAQQLLTEISNTRVLALDFVGYTKDGGDLDEGRRHDLTVKDRLPDVPRRLRPQNPPRGRLIRCTSRRRHLPPNRLNNTCRFDGRRNQKISKAGRVTGARNHDREEIDYLVMEEEACDLRVPRHENDQARSRSGRKP